MQLVFYPKKLDLFKEKENCRMSMITRESKTCVICGKEGKYPVIVSTNEFGARDLDLRPAEMRRSTMPAWVEECDSCGYVSHDVSKLPKDVDDDTVKMILLSHQYAFTEDRYFTSDLAVKFYKHYILNRELKNHRGAFNSLVCAAWACDDADDKDNAAYCRKLAAEYVDTIFEQEGRDDNLLLQKADMLRRSGCFDEVINQYSQASFENELFNKIARFQIEKAKLGDDSRYTVADVK